MEEFITNADVLLAGLAALLAGVAIIVKFTPSKADDAAVKTAAAVVRKLRAFLKPRKASTKVTK